MSVQNFSYHSVQKLLVQSLFNEQKTIPKITTLIDVDDFTDENYKVLYSGLIALNSEQVGTENHKDITVSELYNWTISKNKLVNEKIWPTLIEPTLESPGALAQILKRLSVQNKAKNLLVETSGKLSSDSYETLELLSEVENKINDLSTSLIVKKDDKTHEETVDDLMEYVFKEEPEEIDTVPLFNNSLSDVLNNGWRAEQMIVVGARTGIGKSVFAIDSTVAACNSNRSVLFFSLEMSSQEVLTRMLSVQSDVILNKLKPGREKSQEDKDKLLLASKQIKDWKLEIDDTPGQTMESIKAKSKLKAMSAEGLDMIVIDYLQLITPSSIYGKNRQDQVAEISREIKLLAKTLKVPVMVLVQLKRANKSKEESEDELPTLDDIRESGAIAQDADVVLLIHRKKKEDETDPKALFIIDKNRAGSAPRTVKVRCVLEKSAFRDLTEFDLREEGKEEINLDSFQEDISNDILGDTEEDLFSDSSQSTFTEDTEYNDEFLDDLFD